MSESEIAYQKVLEKLCAKEGVNPGKMMSSPGVCYKGKVFAFFWNENMIFRLGKDYDIQAKFGIVDFEYLNPFKNKPPMKGWYVIDHKYSHLWDSLAEEALNKMI